MRSRLLAALGGTVVLLAALVGCATPGAAGPGGSVPDGGVSDSAPAWEVDAGWVAGGTMIAVVTYGSSSCAPVLGEVAEVDGVVDVTLRDPEAEACTDDLVPQPLAVPVPAGVEPRDGARVTVSLGDARGDIDLPAYTGDPVEEFTPSAGWVGDDAIALLTWGSSSCRPIVESVSVNSAASVVVTFATPPADQVCTMDMAPQLTVAQLDPDVEVDRDATVTLGVVGAEPIPIG